MSDKSIALLVPLSADKAGNILGTGDVNLRRICKTLGVEAVYRDGNISIKGTRHSVEKARAVIYRLIHELEVSNYLSDHSLDAALSFPDKHDHSLEISVPGPAGHIIAKTAGQEKYLRAMKNSEVVFCIGPAGTGKTFLAVASAVAALTDGLVDRIIISRPAVEAGEKLGFLPGDLQQKIDPYLKPVYDALYDTLSPAKVQRSLDNRIIEVAPLAYMRGRTLNNAFVILDEAQNTTITQLKMFITRLGYSSRAVITGDITQIDLKPASSSGLVLIRDILSGIEGIEFTFLNREDVVRHPLVQKIISAFERASGNHAG
ncbi:MAG: PhoH family protein [Candidatus Aegiribacteria sp.]|nr:PhoH family protein [Candidatus Aegiribacteria sp.]